MGSSNFDPGSGDKHSRQSGEDDGHGQQPPDWAIVEGNAGLEATQAHLPAFAGLINNYPLGVCRSKLRFEYPGMILEGIELESPEFREVADLQLLLRHPRIPKLSRLISLNPLFEGPDSYLSANRFVEEFRSGTYFGRTPRLALRRLFDFPTSVNWEAGLPSLSLAVPHRTERHRGPLQVVSHFAPSVIEFSEGINRHSITLLREHELVAEFVCVDDGNTAITTYANVVGMKERYQLCFDGTTPLDFQLFVEELLGPVRKAKFAALGIIVPRLIKELELSCTAAPLESEDSSPWESEMESSGPSLRPSKFRGNKANIMGLQNVSWDLFRIAQRRSDWAMQSLPRHQQSPRFLESFPVTESYTPAESLLVVDPLIGGVARLFWDPKSVQIAVRFTKDLARNPAVYSEVTLSLPRTHTQELLSPLEETESVPDVTRALEQLVERAQNNVRIFGAHVGETYPQSLRSLVLELNSARSDEDRQLEQTECAFRFGFVSGELPALTPNFSQVTSEILRGHYPLYAAVADRELCVPSACQMMLTKHLTGKIRFYSRLGGELHIAIPEECTRFDERRAGLLSLLSTFLYRPEELADDTILAGRGFLSRRVGPIGFRPCASLQRMEAVLRAWWELDRTSGVQGDYAFPLITTSHALLTSSGEMAILLPLTRTETRGIIALFSEGKLSALGLRLESVQGESPEGDDEFPRRAERVLWVSRKGQGLETDALVSFCKLVNNVTSVGRIRARQLKREALTLFAEKDYSVRVSKWSSEQTSQGLFKRWWNSVARVLFQS